MPVWILSGLLIVVKVHSIAWCTFLRGSISQFCVSPTLSMKEIQGLDPHPRPPPFQEIYQRADIPHCECKTGLDPGLLTVNSASGNFSFHCLCPTVLLMINIF